MMLTIADFWLARGMDGFRLDTINFYFHDEALTDNPPIPVNRRNAKVAPAVDPYNYQDHLYDRNQPENIAFLERLRAVMDKYPGRAALGEVGDALRGLDIIADYTKGNKRIHMCYAFDFLAPEKLTADKITTVILNFTKRAQGSWPCWAFSNHDVMRQASRLTDASKNQTSQIKQLAGLLLALTGSLCLYQGEELGLTEADIPFTNLKDPYGAEFCPEYKGRDGCRTPMVWEANTPNSCFSEASQCWLPVDKNHQALAVSRQEDDDGSVLNWYKKAIFARRHNRAMRCGDMVFFDTNDAEILGFWRVLEESRILCLFNFSDKPKLLSALTKNHQIILSQHCQIDSVSGDIVLDGFGMLWGEKNK